MTKFSSTNLVSVVSAKGGTGKTTTINALVSHLAECVRLTIIEAQRENPQYKKLHWGEDEAEVIEIPNVEYQNQTIKLGINSPIFHTKIRDNITIHFLDEPSTIGHQEGFRLFEGGYAFPKPPLGARGSMTSEESKVFSQAGTIASIVQGFDDPSRLIIIDQDAGIDRLTSRLVLPFHRAVHGYGAFQALQEIVAIEGPKKGLTIESAERIYRHFYLKDNTVQITENEEELKKRKLSDWCREDITVFPSPLQFGRMDSPRDYKLRSLSLYEEKDYQDAKRMKSGLLLFVANTAVAELNGLINRSYFFRDLGPNNKYVLIVNNASDDDIVAITRYLEEGMGQSFMFDRVFNLPTVRMPFGNIRAQGNPRLLPKYSNEADSVMYTKKMEEISAYVLSILS